MCPIDTCIKPAARNYDVFGWLQALDEAAVLTALRRNEATAAIVQLCAWTFLNLIFIPAVVPTGLVAGSLVALAVKIGAWRLGRRVRTNHGQPMEPVVSASQIQQQQKS